MEILKEMKRKMASLFSHEDKSPKAELKSQKKPLESLNAEEREILERYPSPRQSTPENRDISPY